MFKDSGRIDQPENTYRDALNLIIDDKKAAVANEYGTDLIGELTYTYYIPGDPNAEPQIVQLFPIGTIKLNDNSLIVFAHSVAPYYKTPPPFLFSTDAIYSAIFKVIPNSKTVTLLYITLGDVVPAAVIIKPFTETHLNFSNTNPITGEYRLSPNGDILIYFTDNRYTLTRDPTTSIEYVESYNPPRVFNVSKQERELIFNPDPTILYGDDKKTTRLLNVFMETPKIPEVTDISILAGGALEVGAYYLAIALADEDLTETNVVTVFNPVYIVPNSDTTVPYEMVTGAPVGTQTNKLIVWGLGSSAKYTQYKYIIPYVVRFSGNDLLAYKLNPVEAGSITQIIYTGLEKAQGASPSDVILDKVKYLAAKSITQLDNKLYMANLVGRKDIGYQRFANNIKLCTIVEEKPLFDPRHYDIFNLNRGYAKMVFPDQTAFSNNSNTAGTWPKFEWLTTREGLTDSYIKNVIKPIQNATSGLNENVSSNGYRNPSYNTFRKGYRRGEVYAFYISFVLKDGTETYAYHIPGRNFIGIENTQFNGNLAVDDGYTTFKPQEITSTDPQAYIYQYLDTSLPIPIPPTVFYNQSNACYNGAFISAPGGPCNTYSYKIIIISYPGENSLVGRTVIVGNAAGQSTTKVIISVTPNTPSPGLTEVRFTTFVTTLDYRQSLGGYMSVPPDSSLGQPCVAYWQNLNETYPNTPDFDVWDVDGNGNGILDLRTTTNREQLVRHHKMPSNHRLDKSFVATNRDFTSPTGFPEDGLNLDRTSVDFKETVRILGIRLDNIKIPKFILKQVQGYKVYYAKRTQGNKTILGQSLAHPATPYLAANLNNTRVKASAGPFYNIWLLEGHHKIGGIHTRDALWVPGTPVGAVLRPGQYLAQPVIKFHDFNLLRTRSTLTPATHIDVQYVVTMQNWTGGYKGAMRVQPPGTVGSTVPGLPNGTRLTFFTSLRSGSGDDEYAWVHPDLGNTINFNATPDSVFYDILGPQVLWGNVYIGAMYNNPGRANIDIGVRSTGPEDGTSPWGNNQGIYYNQAGYNITAKQDQLLNGYQSIFMLESDSATYIDGLSILKTSPGASYKGATYIFNAYGESGITLGLVSGLPALGGYRGNRWSYWGLLGLAYQIRNSGSTSGTTTDRRDFYLEIQNYEYIALDTDKLKIEGFKNILGALIPTSLGQLPQLYLASNFTEFTNNNFTPVISGEPTGRPNVYLVNLCAKKTDVFAPFDEQQLVWTGYYKEIEVYNYDFGGTEVENYYAGASSGNIFGGDTYICKYSYRTTSATFGLAHFIKGKNSTTITGTNNDFIYGDIPFDMNGTTGIPPGDVYNVLNFGGSANTINTINISASEASAGDVTTNNWSLGSVDPFTTLYQVLVESDDNINYRHAGDPIQGVSEADSIFFDKYVAAEVLWKSPLFDLTKMDNILYNDHYSAVQDLRVTVPFPKRDASTSLFPNRVIRSQTQDGTFADQYRYILAFDYKDFAVNKGEITNIFNLNALLYIHTENSLFRTKGKQNLELSDATQAYIGSGDLFAQEPDEFVQSLEGYLGLQNKFGSLVTKDGYIFVARRARKIFMVSDKISDLTEIGLNSWARENIPFELESYGWDADADSNISDSPTFQFGFIISYDPLFKRTIITKRELIPTDEFKQLYSGRTIYYEKRLNWFVAVGDALPQRADGRFFIESGWTISFSHTLSVWASRHSYIPKMYGYNFDFMYSFSDNVMYEHSDFFNPGSFYRNIYNFEIDCIFTGEVRRTQQGTVSTKGDSKLYSAFTYTADVYQKSNIASIPKQQFDPGFTSYYIYNTTQISGEEIIQYLTNIRKVDSEWTLNNFRDMASIVPNSILNQGQVTVSGDFYSSTLTHDTSQQMFLSEGVINNTYINPTKLWYERRKFVDKFAGIRLIYNNQTRNLINLYGVTAASRVSAR